MDLFNNKIFLKCVGDGLRNKDSFVRKHYIKFAQKIVLPNLLKILTKEQAAKQIKILLKAFVELMLKIDVTHRIKEHTEDLLEEAFDSPEESEVSNYAASA